MSGNNLKRLRHDTPYSQSALIILKHKHRDSRKKARRFLEDPSVENLHSLRISIRRLRYSLENFEVCYKKDIFKEKIDYLKYIQDLIGVGRDLDVLKETIHNIALEKKAAIPEMFFNTLDEKKEKALHEIKLELLKFLNDKSLKNFFNNKED